MPFAFSRFAHDVADLEADLEAADSNLGKAVVAFVINAPALAREMTWVLTKPMTNGTQAPNARVPYRDLACWSRRRRANQDSVGKCSRDSD
jgi:hypothetical protein